ncbi:MAG TPA: acyltransferase domain-containing protein [Candidatus Nanopelagicaceae bacterium]|nr:acyltransferase domain-containing protein [Candidatus Nanopelagicaceae bacterium]
MLAIVAPGQGAQTPGFLTPWLTDARSIALMDWWSAVSGIDLRFYGTEGDADQIRDTAIAQPLLVSAGLLAGLALFPHPSDSTNKVGVVAGHSVGELTAAAGARAITAESAMVLVRERGAAMAAASSVTPTGMTAVLGGDRDEVLASIAAHGLTAANENGAGQIVAAGTLAQLAQFAATPPLGARLRELAVAGAFHTQHMAPAVDRLNHLAKSVTVKDPVIRVISNKDGAVVHHGREVLDRIVGQIASPVRWDLCMRTLSDLGVTGVIEVPPAGTLTGLIKRTLPNIETLALKTPDDLPAARDLIARHGSPSSFESEPTWRLIVAPFKGTFHSLDITLGSTLSKNAAIGQIESRSESVTMTTEHGGVLIEWLAEDGDPVSPGQPLARLHPNSQEDH